MTVTPCFTCGKMFANSHVKRIVALEEYVHGRTRHLLNKAEIEVQIYDSNKR